MRSIWDHKPGSAAGSNAHSLQRAPKVVQGTAPTSSWKPAEHPLLQLQLRRGNRYVQRLVARMGDGLLQRQEEVVEAEPDSDSDPELALGNKLWQEAPAGVAVAIYESANETAVNNGMEWAAREKAIGPIVLDGPVDAENLDLGYAFSDERDMQQDLVELGEMLATVTAKAAKPAGIEPLPGTGPSRIRTLALFSHGVPRWIGIEPGMSLSNSDPGMSLSEARDLVRAIAPYLAADVKVLLYACSVGRGLEEEQDWSWGTFAPGGADSMAGEIRDTLIEEGEKMAEEGAGYDFSQAEVWGHTTRGHVVNNAAWRVFHGVYGKGSEGRGYASDFVFGTVEKVIALNEVEEEVAAQGYEIPADILEKFRAKVYKELSGSEWGLFYDCYAQADAELEYQGASLAEMCAVDPLGVADVIAEYWRSTFWPVEKPRLVKRLIAKFKLKKP